MCIVEYEFLQLNCLFAGKLWTINLIISCLFCCRWNIWLWKNIWTAISRCYFWNKCSIFHSRMEKWFQGSGFEEIHQIKSSIVKLILFLRMKMLELLFISCIMLVNNVSNTVLRNIIFRKISNKYKKKL